MQTPPIVAAIVPDLGFESEERLAKRLLTTDSVD